MKLYPWLLTLMTIMMSVEARIMRGYVGMEEIDGGSKGKASLTQITLLPDITPINWDDCSLPLPMEFIEVEIKNNTCQNWHYPHLRHVQHYVDADYEVRVAIIVANFPGHPVNYLTPQEIGERVFGWNEVTPNINQFYSELSNGKKTLYIPHLGDNLYVFNITQEISGECPFDDIHQEILREMTAARISPANDIISIYLADNWDCPFSGRGYIGPSTLTRPRHTLFHWNLTPSFNTWLHEFGHNFGMHHASTDRNDDGVIESEYGDTTDFMGGLPRTYQVGLNAPHYIESLWKVGNIISDNGTYSLHSLAGRNGNILQFPRYIINASGHHNREGNYYFSYRSLTGLDQKYNSFYQNKVFIHSWVNANLEKTKLIAALGEGEIWKGDFISVYAESIRDEMAWINFQTDKYFDPRFDNGSNNVDKDWQYIAITSLILLFIVVVAFGVYWRFKNEKSEVRVIDISEIEKK